jgi:hypothetical protein
MNKILVCILIFLSVGLLSLIIYRIIKKNNNDNYTDKYTDKYPYKKFVKSVNPQNFALILTMYNVENRKEMYMDVIKYYVDELKFPKNNLYIVDSSGNGIDESYVYKNNQLVYNQDDYKEYINKLTRSTGPSKYEILSLELVSKKFDFSSFNYVVKLTCKYKIPEIYTINDTTCNSILLLQKNTDLDNFDIYQNTEILGIKGSEFVNVIDGIIKLSYNSILSLEEIMMKLAKNISNCELPFLSSISNYKRNDKNVIHILSKPNIPKIIHKVFINDDSTLFLDDEVVKVHNTWLNLNKGYTLKLWNKNDCRKYLINNFPKEIIKAFDKLIPYAYKSDFFRYCIIYKEGGWYSDWTQECYKYNLLKKLTNERKQPIVVFKDRCGYKLEKTKPYKNDYISNGFFGASKESPILRECITKVIENVKNEYYGDNRILPTGPGLIGNIYCKYYILKDDKYYESIFYYIDKKKVIKTKIDRFFSQNMPKGNDYRKLWKNKDIYIYI